MQWIIKLLKNTKLITLHMKVNKIDKKIPHATTLISINQYSTDKQNSQKKNRDVDKKIPDISGLVTTTVLNTKIKKLITK